MSLLLRHPDNMHTMQFAINALSRDLRGARLIYLHSTRKPTPSYIHRRTRARSSLFKLNVISSRYSVRPLHASEANAYLLVCLPTSSFLPRTRTSPIIPAGIVGALKFMQIDQAGFEDRVYRLHYNSGQKRTDDFSTVGALFGLAAAAVLVPRAGGGAATAYGMMLLGGAAVGSAAGIVAHVATTPKELK